MRFFQIVGLVAGLVSVGLWVFDKSNAPPSASARAPHRKSGVHRMMAGLEPPVVALRFRAAPLQPASPPVMPVVRPAPVLPPPIPQAPVRPVRAAPVPAVFVPAARIPVEAPTPPAPAPRELAPPQEPGPDPWIRDDPEAEAEWVEEPAVDAEFEPEPVEEYEFEPEFEPVPVSEAAEEDS